MHYDRLIKFFAHFSLVANQNTPSHHSADLMFEGVAELSKILYDNVILGGIN